MAAWFRNNNMAVKMAACELRFFKCIITKLPQITLNYCMFDFEIKGISEAINWIVHDESLPAKPEWRYLIYRTGLSHTKLCIGKWERRGPVR